MVKSAAAMAGLSAGAWAHGSVGEGADAVSRNPHHTVIPDVTPFVFVTSGM